MSDDDTYARQMRSLRWSFALVAVVELLVVAFILHTLTGHL